MTEFESDGGFLFSAHESECEFLDSTIFLPFSVVLISCSGAGAVADKSFGGWGERGESSVEGRWT